MELRIVGEQDVPETSFRSNREVLQDEPDADLVVRVCQFEGTRGLTSDKVPGEHSAGSWLLRVRDLGRWQLRLLVISRRGDWRARG